MLHHYFPNTTVPQVHVREMLCEWFVGWVGLIPSHFFLLSLTFCLCACVSFHLSFVPSCVCFSSYCIAVCLLFVSCFLFLHVLFAFALSEPVMALVPFSWTNWRVEARCCCTGRRPFGRGLIGQPKGNRPALPIKSATEECEDSDHFASVTGPSFPDISVPVGFRVLHDFSICVPHSRSPLSAVSKDVYCELNDSVLLAGIFRPSSSGPLSTLRYPVQHDSLSGLFHVRSPLSRILCVFLLPGLVGMLSCLCVACSISVFDTISQVCFSVDVSFLLFCFFFRYF